MSFPAYEFYQDSDCDVFGEVPSHWSVQRLKNSTVINMGQSPSSDDYNIDGDGDGFLQGNADFGDEYPVARSYCPVATKLANAGDILLSVRAPVGAINTADQTYGIGRGLCAMTANKAQCPRYLYYSLHLVREALLSIATGSTYEAVTVDQVANAAYLSPPFDEQKAISSFLDVETSKIDGLVSEQRRLIELLKEKRQAVISHAVTKGLNPNAPMKPSGIQWLGDVPQHWSVVALKHLVSRPIIDGPHESPEKHDDGIPFVSAESIGKGFIDFDKKWGYIAQEDHDRYSKRYKPQRGDILLVKLGATTGVPAIVETDIEFNVWVPLAAIRLKTQYQPRFIFHVLRSNNLRVAYELNWTYGTQQTLGLGTISNLRMPLPPSEERQQIVEYLDSVLPGFDSLEAEAERAIELLQERRTALISAAVTGKIDIRGFVA